MKHFKSLGLALLVLGATACTEGNLDDQKVEPVLNPIKSVIAMDGETELTGKIDHAKKTITFDPFQYVADLKAIQVKIEVEKDAKLVSPAAVSTLDLSKPCKVIVNNRLVDLTYTMTAVTGEVTPIKAAGFQLVDTYNPLPDYIKVYKNTKLGVNNEETGFLVEVKKGATFSLAGNGSVSSAPNMEEVVKTQKNWIVYVNGMCGMKSCSVLNGELNYSSGSAVTAFAILKDGKFAIAPQVRMTKEDGSKTIARLSAKGLLEEKEDGTKVYDIVDPDWLPKVNLAMGGTALLISEGRPLTPEEQKATDGNYSYGWWDGNKAGYQREAIGINKDADVVYFFVSSNEKGGLSMKEVQDVMVAIKCHDAMYTEGGGSSNVFIKGQKTINDCDAKKGASNILLVK